MASLIMAAEPLVVPVAATVVLQPIDTGPSACGQQPELTAVMHGRLLRAHNASKMPFKRPSRSSAGGSLERVVFQQHA